MLLQVPAVLLTPPMVTLLLVLLLQTPYQHTRLMCVAFMPTAFSGVVTEFLCSL